MAGYDIANGESGSSVRSKLNTEPFVSLAQINDKFTDGTSLIDTTDPRLSDSRSPTAHTHNPSEVGLGNVENTAISTWGGTATITTVGTIATGTWQGGTIAVAKGGTGQTTAQAAIDALTDVASATDEHVLTKDTATGNVVFKAAGGGGGGAVTALNNQAENRLVTIGSTTTELDGEQNLTFDGSTLTAEASATPSILTIRGQNSVGTNIAATSLRFIPPRSTGNASPGSVVVRTSTAGSSGSASQSTADFAEFNDGRLRIVTPGLSFSVASGLVSGTQPLIQFATVNSNANIAGITASAAAANRPIFQSRRSRGTLTSPSAVVADDQLLSFLAGGYDGSAVQFGAAVDVYCDGTVSSGVVPMRLSFVTGSSSGSRSERMTVKSTGKIGINESDPDSYLHITGSSGNPLDTLKLEQLATTHAFLNLNATSAANTTNPLTSWTSGNSIQGFMRARVNGTIRWIPFYDAPTA